MAHRLRLWLLAMVLWLPQVQAAEQGVAAADLPAEARETLRLIRNGGPFPYERDGAVFGNYERILPKRPRGYYHEYTVQTPGARNRGARRIVCGKPVECYYSPDHYRTFKRIGEQP
ncbi:MAG: ribonuclease [Nitrosomonadales bacterium]|nr:ribonuclease [Nitrosomonadales bacterium]